jgi:hypothetical protein
MPNQPTPPPTPPATPDDKAQLDSLLQKIETHRGRPCLVYWTGPFAKVSVVVDVSLFDQLCALRGTRPTIESGLDLILNTNGGDAEAPWRIISMIREYTSTLNVLLPYRALSAGTTMALGADEIVMTPLSVLGPTDPSRTHPLLPRREGASEPEAISVQDMRHAMQFIRETGAPQGTRVEYTPDALASIFAALFDKIHPLAIGAIEQSYALAKLVSRRCLETHMTQEGDNERISAIVDRLCDDYKSHGYQIGRREAKAIGLKVVEADGQTEALLTELLKFYLSRPAGPLGQAKPGTKARINLAWLDSRILKLRAEQEISYGQKSEVIPGADGWVEY